MRFISHLVVALLFSVHIVVAGPIEDCQEYAAYGVPGNAGNLLCRKGYFLSHDPSRKTPIWVIEHLTREKSGTLKRSGRFKADADLVPGDRAELVDYTGSGYDRGHMAPSADMAWDSQAMVESFYLSNMVPQVGEGMNRGIWAELEKKVRLWARERGELFVYSGPIYTTNRPSKTIGPNRVAVPNFLYKIVLDPAQKEALAFVMPNQSLPTKDMPKYLVPVREVEQQTGLDFFSVLNPEAQDRLERKKAPGLWQ